MNQTPTTIDKLPLGANFRYAESGPGSAVFVLLSRPGINDRGMVADADPANYGENVSMQGIYSFGERDTLIIPVVEPVSRKDGWRLAHAPDACALYLTAPNGTTVVLTHSSSALTKADGDSILSKFVNGFNGIHDAKFDSVDDFVRFLDGLHAIGVDDENPPKWDLAQKLIGTIRQTPTDGQHVFLDIDQPLPTSDEMVLRTAIFEVAASLRDNEWCDRFFKDPALAALETEITHLVNRMAAFRNAAEALMEIPQKPNPQTSTAETQRWAKAAREKDAKLDDMRRDNERMRAALQDLAQCDGSEANVSSALVLAARVRAAATAALGDSRE